MAQFDAGAVEETVQGVLGGRVTGAPCHRDVAEYGTHDHDMAVAPFHPSGRQRLGQRHRREQIYLHQLAVGRHARIQHGRALGNAGIVHQHVDGAEVAGGARGEGLRVIELGQVDGQHGNVVRPRA